jgi:hypothetical protein
MDQRPPVNRPAPPRRHRAASLAALARRGRPPYAEMLLAVAGEFRPVDHAAALDRLDDLGRRLFGAAALDAPAAGQKVAAVLGLEVGLQPRRLGLDSLLLDEVLRSRAGHPLLLAVVYLEAGRRAGLSPSLVSAGSAWMVALGHGATLTVVDPAPDPAGDPEPERMTLRRHCPHEVAHSVLGAIGAHLEARRDADGARRAGELRSLLAVG